MTWTMQEENKDKLHIRLRVCDTEIPIRVYREEEEVYRRAAALVTSIVNLYTSRAQGKKGTIEILYMALIDIALMRTKRSAMTQNLSTIFSPLSPRRSRMPWAIRPEGPFVAGERYIPRRGETHHHPWERTKRTGLSGPGCANINTNFNIFKIWTL